MISVVIPCYNEAKNLERGVLDEVYQYLAGQTFSWEVVIVDDESTDDSKNLGPGFCIGHSYFCDINNDVEYDENWYNRIVGFEIGPLLSEYWFDNPEKANQQIEALKI